MAASTSMFKPRSSPTLYQDVIKNAARWPNTMAVSDSATGWTWREFEAAVANAADRLEEAGVKSGSVVAVYMANSAEYVALVYAVWALGSTFCPINYRLSVSEVAQMMEDVDSKHLVVDDEHADVELSGVRVMRSRAVFAGEPGSEQREAISVHIDAPAWLFFTSGTSGRPKPAVISHGQLQSVVSNGILDLMSELSRRDAALAVAPLSHGALTHVLRQVRLGGHTVVYDRPRFEESTVLRMIVSASIRSTFLVPTMIRRLCDAAQAQGKNYHGTLTTLLSGGELLTRPVVNQVEKVFGPILTNYYGLAEVTGAISQALPHEVHDGTDGPVSAGMPRFGTTIQLRKHDGSLAAEGEHGEIWVSGTNMFIGYLWEDQVDNEELSTGWFRTKDVAYQIENRLYIDGRTSDMFISGGSNVYPAEIERVLNAHHSVRESAVIGIADESWGEVGIAFVVLNDESVTSETLTAHVRKQLSGYKVPKHFEFVNELPFTAMDKIDKKALKDSFILERVRS